MKKDRMIITLLLAGSLFFCCGFSRGTVKSGVVVEGVQVGGMSYIDAENAVRARIQEELFPLVVHTPKGDFTYLDELSFTDNVDEILRSARRGEEYAVRIRRNWADMEEALYKLCEENTVAPKDAELVFSPAGFTYLKGENGTSCNYAKLLADATEALEAGGEVTLSCRARKPKVTEEMLRARTRLLASFSTGFDGGNVARSHNVRLAAMRVSGTVIGAGEEFSFNTRVGKRTKENGFVEATVIQQGEFVQGVGGGVCQTSTTLMGAAIRAGMKITLSRPHSLTVSYVPPSQDAMVSDFSDLKFVNPNPYPVYILARTGKSTVKFEFYGMPSGRRYEIESVVLEHVAPPPEEVTEGEEDRVIRAPREGLKSESWLLEYDGAGRLLSRTLIRRDSYAAVQGKRETAPPPAPEENSEEDGNFLENGDEIG